MVKENCLTKLIQDNHLSKKIICIHSSLKSFGLVENGARTIIQAFLKEGCTLIVPTFSWNYLVNPKANEQKYIRNAWDYNVYFNENENLNSYTIHSKEIDADDMGIIPTTILDMKNCIRGDHPLCSFSGIGPKSRQIIKKQKWKNIYGFFDLFTKLNGQIVLMGVTLKALSYIHYIEQKAGRKLFIRWVKNQKNEIVEVETGGCSDGFDKLEKVIQNDIIKIKVGNSNWMIMESKKIFNKLADEIRDNPKITCCNNINCLRCIDIENGGPIKNYANR